MLKYSLCSFPFITYSAATTAIPPGFKTRPISFKLFNDPVSLREFQEELNCYCTALQKSQISLEPRHSLVTLDYHQLASILIAMLEVIGRIVSILDLTRVAAGLFIIEDDRLYSCSKTSQRICWAWQDIDMMSMKTYFLETGKL